MVLLLLLGAMFLLRGGELFSPGEVSAQGRPGVMLGGFESHADFEAECQRCHRPLETTQDVLCLECHLTVKEQLDQQSGTHAQIPDVRDCASCHAEHRGRDFNPTETAYARFDHSATRFSLLRHSLDYQAVPLACNSCHLTDRGFELVENVCQDCHAREDANFMAQHNVEFGLDCLACHDGLDTMARFNHNTTLFPLDGAHTQASCAACHKNGNFETVAVDCLACHAEPAIHQGLFDLDCSLCHTTLAWKPAVVDGVAFEHARTANFSLQRHDVNFDGSAITCVTCHPQSVQSFELPICVQCHAQQDGAFMSAHQALFGSDCLACHDGVDRFSDFDHANVFPLAGRHAEIACEACHANQTFLGTPSACVQCHQEPAIHAGWFGLKCQYCHNDTGWIPARLTIHPFPLNHGSDAQLSCETCHQGAYTEYTCYACHEHQPAPIAESHVAVGVSAQELPACAECHPAGELRPGD